MPVWCVHCYADPHNYFDGKPKDTEAKRYNSGGVFCQLSVPILSAGLAEAVPSPGREASDFQDLLPRWLMMASSQAAAADDDDDDDDDAWSWLSQLATFVAKSVAGATLPAGRNGGEAATWPASTEAKRISDLRARDPQDEDGPLRHPQS